MSEYISDYSEYSGYIADYSETTGSFFPHLVEVSTQAMFPEGDYRFAMGRFYTKEAATKWGAEAVECLNADRDPPLCDFAKGGYRDVPRD